MKRLIIPAVLILFIMITSCKPEEASVASPDNNSAITFSIDPAQDDQLLFSVTYHGREIIGSSPVVIDMLGDSAIGKNLSIISSEVREINVEWERVVGKSKHVVNHCNEIVISLKENKVPSRDFRIIARAYEDGVAFRYQLPQNIKSDSLFIRADNTLFNFTEDYEVWTSIQPGLNTAQERVFFKTSLSGLREKDILAPPLLINLNNGWAALLEADLVNWAGLLLSSGKDSSTTVKAIQAPIPSRPDRVVEAIPGAVSPWKVIMLGNKPGDLIESNIVHNLSEPNKLEDVSWIKAGRCAWDCWWCGGYAPKAGFKLDYNTASMKYFIDLASDMGWEYQLVDWLWYKSVDKKYQPYPDGDVTKAIPEIDMPELLSYAKSKNVRLFVWMHWKHADEQMDAAFPLYEKWGIAGVKVDFMNSNDQEMVNFYHRVIKKAAQHKLLVDFHGAYMPAGEDRAYPNLLTREGVLGNEANKWADKISPEHCVTLPFTRMLGGQMDFTPGGFNHAPFGTFKPSGMDTENPLVQGTRCFQLAMPVVYESALTVYCDSPDNYRGAEGIDFYKAVPTTWDETKVIDGYPGEFIIVARRNGTDWFIGAMTNDKERSIDIPLSFLGEGKYRATIYSDASDAEEHPENLDQTETDVDMNGKLTAKLAKGGGYAVHLQKVE